MMKPGCTVALSIDFHDWMFGWADCFAFMGVGLLSIGPLAFHVTWPPEA